MLKGDGIWSHLLKLFWPHTASRMLKANSCLFLFIFGISFYKAHCSRPSIRTWATKVLSGLKIFLIYEMISKPWTWEAVLTSVHLMMVFLEGSQIVLRLLMVMESPHRGQSVIIYLHEWLFQPSNSAGTEMTVAFSCLDLGRAGLCPDLDISSLSAPGQDSLPEIPSSKAALPGRSHCI